MLDRERGTPAACTKSKSLILMTPQKDASAEQDPKPMARVWTASYKRRHGTPRLLHGTVA